MNNPIDDKKKKTVLLAMDGSLQASVAAYLLKKQGLNCIAISLVFGEGSSLEWIKPFLIPDVKAVKDLCKILEIGHYAIDAKDLFKDQVIDNIVAAKLSGKFYDPSFDIAKVIFDSLLSKMKVLKAEYISSGHFAGISHNQKEKSYTLCVANDYKYDESFRLAKLTDLHFSKLLLPLSDIQYDGVLKISELINWEFQDIFERKINKQNVFFDPELIKVVEGLSPFSLREKGDIIQYGEDGTLAEHLGVHRYYLGQDKIIVKGEMQIDQKLQVVKIDSHRKTLFLYYPKDLIHTHCKIYNLNCRIGLNKSSPLRCYIVKDTNDKKKQGTLFFKTNGTAVFVFEEEQEGLLCSGTNLTFYDKKAEGGRVIGSGELLDAGYLLGGRFRILPESKIEKEISPANKPAPLDMSLKF